MKKTAQKTGGDHAALPQLGGLAARDFLRKYWQKRPLLIRGAFPQFADPLNKREVLELARRDDAESRIVVKTGNHWDLRHGPFTRKDFALLKGALWTVLIQDTQHFSNEACAVLSHFNFIPHARVDDLMVSYAVPGAGVGAHVDSYDVFLLQGTGARRWKISSQTELHLRKDVPLKILKHFKAEQEYVLESGDMLYLPPGYAHHGVAETECLTWSIGFRAPSQQELSTGLLDYLRDEIKLDGQYQDPDLTPSAHPGEIDVAMTRRVDRLLGKVRHMAQDEKHLLTFLGTYLTEPKSNVYFDPPEPIMGRAAFQRKSARVGVKLDLRSKLLYQEGCYFLNGRQFAASGAAAAAWRHLADTRHLPANRFADGLDSEFHDSLYAAYKDGFLQIGGLTRQLALHAQEPTNRK